MTRQELFALAAQRYGTVPEYPWQDDNAVLRRKDNEKWYAVVLRVAPHAGGLFPRLPHEQGEVAQRTPRNAGTRCFRCRFACAEL